MIADLPHPAVATLSANLLQAQRHGVARHEELATRVVHHVRVVERKPDGSSRLAGTLNNAVARPSKARDHRGNDVIPMLRATDDRYWVMPRIGDSGSIEFPVPPRESGRRRTVFLHGRGYYKLHIEKSNRAPDRERLKEIMEKPGGAVRFAAECLARQIRHLSGSRSGHPIVVPVTRRP